LVNSDGRGKDTPGPATYDSPSRIGKDGPKNTMGGRGVESISVSNVGPGSYLGHE
jgi:hypothetical protein